MSEGTFLGTISVCSTLPVAGLINSERVSSRVNANELDFGVVVQKTLLMAMVFVPFLGTSLVRGDDSLLPIQLKVLSYNIHHGEGTDSKLDLNRLAKIIQKVDPDLVALQEVDQNTRRTGVVNQIEVLAAQTGLFGQFAKQLDYGGGEYGQAILSKHPIQAFKVHWLPGEPDRERRIVGVAEFQIHGNTFLFGTTHLHHARVDLREGQTRELDRLFAQGTLPMILAGDFNASPDSQAIQMLQQEWRMATSEPMPTFPAESPTRQLDYVVVRPANSWRIVKAMVLDEPLASDHRPVLVELEWLGEN
ncbi:endonuclease/exonuclease/phosphatase family protein [Rhodopirellula islandica]|uniref:endonuclease/exonuclease/phosphatase family protein n=1 Tax=Rhodopirellula islandica TaxID=595434 RepID=UPI001F29F07B|nr:endonuclease/exonuclease/phosphatase family protein [Rhodopirellula islandica]